MDVLVVLVFCLSFTLCCSQSRIEGIRLIGDSNVYAGKVTIRYNGTWGTICSTSWGLNDAQVACRMLGYYGAACGLTNSYGRASSSIPIWMANVGCSGNENYLDSCPFYGWGEQNHYCTRSYSYDAGVICTNGSLIGIPEVSVANTTTRSITITWPGVSSPISNKHRRRYVVQYNTTGYSSRLLYTSFTYYNTPRINTITITNLIRDRNYSISVRHEVTIFTCGYYTYVPGPYSEPVIVSTNDIVPPSIFGVRLISPVTGMNFLGRVEVRYNNVWGMVCDNAFGISDANVICNMLNYTRAASAVSNARLGRGSGRIWLNRLSCSNAEILDDCSYTFSRSSDHLTITAVIIAVATTTMMQELFVYQRYSYRSYSLSWRIVIQYTRSDRTGSYTAYPYYTSSTSYTFSSLPTGVTFNATIRVQGRFSNYYCYTYIDGAMSNNVVFATRERPPSSPPLNFHIAVVNCSAIRAEWRIPSYNHRNGIIRGYKLMYSTPNAREKTINLAGSITEYIIGNLTSSTDYEVSILAYTIGDGPRSIYLTATTNSEDICQTDVINVFGINGNGIDRTTVYSYSSGINILCHSNLPVVQIDWLYLNGSKVGVANLNVREGRYANDTAVLQVGRFGRITVCDAGTYICRANQTSSGRAQQRTFKVTVNSNPPTPGRPMAVHVTATSATIQWPHTPCYGGHDIQYYNIRIGYYRYFYSSISYWYINNIDARNLNYSIYSLSSRTNYFISVRAQGKDYTYSSYSSSITITTLPPVPTPPRDVTVTLVALNVILVTWSRPSVANGRIAYYTVYARPFVSQFSPVIRSRRQAQSLQIVSKNFSAATSSGNLTLPQLGLEYHIQVRVTVLDTTTRINQQSLYSPLTSNSTIFVPIPGLPSPRNVRVLNSFNSSITIGWTNPGSNDTLTGYLIEYSAVIEGRSLLGNLIRFTHAGNTTVPPSANMTVIEPLVPQTTYLFRVSILTTRGEGMQVGVRGTTAAGASGFEQFVYFHIRFGPVLSCQGFRRDIEGQEEIVKRQLFYYLRGSCQCGLTEQHIIKGIYSCGQQSHQIIFRAHILGTRNYSATNLVGLLQRWIQRGTAYIIIDSFRMMLDPTCPTKLDTLDDPECSVVHVMNSTIPTSHTPTTTKIISPNFKAVTSGNPYKEVEKPTKEVQPQVQRSVTEVSTIGGLFIGSVIALLLLILIVLIVVIVYSKFYKSHKSSRTRDGSNIFSNSPSTVRFSEFENSDDMYMREEPEEKDQDI